MGKRGGRRGERGVDRSQSEKKAGAQNLQTSLCGGKFPSRPLFLSQGMSFPLLEECKMCSE